ncbi:hypothetical protein [Candidatus Nitrosacidococcus sp. I8]|uniref:hypothetical protein n=1 Tax=Candidatus Nitrosacidococcus sp. I8 TaxID=2942908 RepID=UPI0022265C15|nr:hypothetical protein [Candidatus Nitrosacidococcus sp. I8]CAH9018379.1 hypothetical protein NURINAE_00891 [Candidatus Nitrosacidococcus sp. I8]
MHTYINCAVVKRQLKPALAGTALLTLIALATPVLAAPITSTFNYTGSAQTFIAPTAGTYQIIAYGAAGGFDNSDSNGGLGGEIGGGFFSFSG